MLRLGHAAHQGSDRGGRLSAGSAGLQGQLRPTTTKQVPWLMFQVPPWAARMRIGSGFNFRYRLGDRAHGGGQQGHPRCNGCNSFGIRLQSYSKSVVRSYFTRNDQEKIDGNHSIAGTRPARDRALRFSWDSTANLTTYYILEPPREILTDRRRSP